MSEHQYYEFRAIDRPLDADDMAALREISSRARISPTAFVNTYQWGDLKADPADLVSRWFDLHFYRANYGTLRLMLRLPAEHVDRRRLEALAEATDTVAVANDGSHVILDIVREDDDPDWELEDEDIDVDALARLRADLLAGDERLLYLVWLFGVGDGEVADDETEPLPGLAPLTPALETFAALFAVDGDLLEAAEEQEPAAAAEDGLRRFVTALPEADKTALLVRLVEGDPHVVAELRRRAAAADAPAGPPARTAGALRQRASEIAEVRRQRHAAAEAERERQRQAAAEAERRRRLDDLAALGDKAWSLVEAEVVARHVKAYDRAVALLADLRVIAAEAGRSDEYARRLAALHHRHAAKQRFIERLATLPHG